MPRMYHTMFRQMHKQLGQLNAWFDAAEAHAKALSFDADGLLSARLAPDQFPLVRQVQIACDTAKLGASRITGKDAPSHADDETTIAALRERVHSVQKYLDGLSAADFDGVATRTVTQPRWEGQVMSADDYFREHVVPNFFFHLAHVYALLRHNGVKIGKRDYLGALSKRAP
jgi:hypothetical protein